MVQFGIGPKKLTTLGNIFDTCFNIGESLPGEGDIVFEKFLWVFGIRKGAHRFGSVQADFPNFLQCEKCIHLN